MDFYMYHGRTNPNGGPQSLIVSDYGDRIEYYDIDDWGFEGPRLEGVVGFHCTYGSRGHWNLYFKDSRAKDKAQRLTGWSEWCEDALTVKFDGDNVLVRIDGPAYGIPHYFGDWGIK